MTTEQDGPTLHQDEMAALYAMPKHERLACLLCGGLEPGEASGSADLCLHDYGPISVQRLLTQNLRLERQVLDLLSGSAGKGLDRLEARREGTDAR